MNILLPLHILFIIATGALVLYSDEQGFMWILGKKETLPRKKLEWLHSLVGVGLAAIIATGGLLFLRSPQFYLGQTDFIVKMVFVLALAVNGFFVGSMVHHASTSPWRQLSWRARLPFLISGGVSVASWAGALLCGLLLR